jgi:hypothetical protein
VSDQDKALRILTLLALKQTFAGKKMSQQFADLFSAVSEGDRHAIQATIGELGDLYEDVDSDSVGTDGEGQS